MSSDYIYFYCHAHHPEIKPEMQLPPPFSAFCRSTWLRVWRSAIGGCQCQSWIFHGVIIVLALWSSWHGVPDKQPTLNRRHCNYIYESDDEKLNVISTSHVGELTLELEYSSFILQQSYILHFNKDNHIIFTWSNHVWTIEFVVWPRLIIFL